MVNKKYYEKVNTFYNLLNYPGMNAESDSVMLGGRSKYDVILDYLTYKYDQIVEQMAYEPDVYYEFIGYAETELEGMYGLSAIPIYQLLTGSIPDDWGSSDKYFTRTKMTVLERPHSLYFNDGFNHFPMNVSFVNSIKKSRSLMYLLIQKYCCRRVLFPGLRALFQINICKWQILLC